MLLDGGLVCLYLMLLVLVDWPLGLLVVGLGCLQVVVLGTVGRTHAAADRREPGSGGPFGQLRVPAVRGIETLKAAGIEQRGVEHWANLFAAEINAALARGRLSATVDSLMGGVRLASPLAILAVGGAQVLAGQLSLGTMLALSALRRRISRAAGHARHHWPAGAAAGQLHGAHQRRARHAARATRPGRARGGCAAGPHPG